MHCKKVLTYQDLKPRENQPKTDETNTRLTENLTYGNEANKYTRKFIKHDSSYTQTTIKHLPTLFALEEKIKLMRSKDPTFDELFNAYLLTSTDSSAIDVRLESIIAKEHGLGNCDELSCVSMKRMRKYNRTISRLALVKSDHTIVMIDDPDHEGCAILDTLNEISYPISMIYEKLKCYTFDRDQNDPHILTPFTKENELRVKALIKCFTEFDYNEALVSRFCIKLYILEKSFKKFSKNCLADKEIAKIIADAKLEVDKYDLEELTNLKLERLLDRKIKHINKTFQKYIRGKVIENKEDFCFDIILNMRSLFPSYYTYFKHLLYFEPLFSQFLNYIKNQNKNEFSHLRFELKNKLLLNDLLRKVIVMKRPRIHRDKAVKVLLDYGANPAIDCNGETVLTWSAKHNKFNIIEKLIYQPKLFRMGNSRGLLPIHLAAKYGYTEIIELIFNHIPNLINAQDKEGLTPLHYAALFGHINLVSKLVSAGVSMTLLTNDKELPLHHAARNGHLAIVKLILSKKPQLINAQDKDGWTPLHYACNNGYPDLVEELLKNGAKPEMKDSDGRIALDLAQASKNANAETIELIIMTIKKYSGINEDENKSGQGRNCLIK